MKKAKRDSKPDVSRRAFMQGTAAAFPILSATTLMAAETQVWQGLKAPIAGKIIEQKQQQLPYGTEVQSTTEFTGADGKQDTVKQYLRKVDMGDSYVVFTHTASVLRGAYLLVLTGTKGTIEGNTRTDTIEAVLISQDGTVQQLPKQTTKVRLDNPFKGMTPQETMDEMMRMKAVNSVRDSNP